MVRSYKTRNYRTVARVDGHNIQDDKYAVVARIEGNKILDASYRPVALIEGDKILDASYRSIATMSDVRRAIEGPGGVTLAALWYFFVR
jgi:hypothetical protein